MFLRSITLLREEVPDFHSYPFNVPSISGMDALDLENEVTFFVGENGSGKSTLLEAVADKCRFNTAGGGRNNLYDVESSHAALGNYIRLSWMPKTSQGFFLRAESFYHFASHLDQLARDDRRVYEAYGGKSLHHQSHGESFLSLFLNRFSDEGLYLLDEPEAALSPARLLAFMRVIHQLVSRGNSQFIIATHSPILLGFPNAKIFSFDADTIESITYEDTDHYQITKGFLNRKERYLEELFLDDEEE